LSNVDTTTTSGDVTLSGAYSPDTNTVLLIHFNEDAGRHQDNSVNKYHAVSSSGTWTSDGKFGNALSFDGVHDHVKIHRLTQVRVTEDYTIECWIKPTNVNSSTNQILLENSWGSYDRNGISIKDGLIRFGYYVRQGWRGASGPISDNRWVHVAGVKEVTSVSLYLNGILQTGTARPSVATAGLLIGSSRSKRLPYTGIIDELRVSDKARSVDELVPSSGYFSSGTITSRTINSGEPFTNIRLDWDDTRPPGTSITYFASNDGGAHWYELPGDSVLFAFPSPGNDLRVKAILTRGNGTPTLHSWKAEF